MFTKKRKSEPASESAPRRRGRPRGETEQGAAARQHLYETALRLIAAGGYADTTLRQIAEAAGVSVGLLYRYFPSKRAVVLAFHDELSAEYAEQAAELPAGSWHARFLFAVRKSLGVLAPHRDTLAALVPILIGDSEEGVLGTTTGFSRERVLAVFIAAVRAAPTEFDEHEGTALGRLLYVAHLAIILWWLLDKSPHQQATTELLALLAQAGPLCDLALQLPFARHFITTADSLVQRGLFGSGARANSAK